MVIYSERITKQKLSELLKNKKKETKQNRKKQCGHKHNCNHSFWYSLQIYSSMVQRSRSWSNPPTPHSGVSSSGFIHDITLDWVPAVLNKELFKGLKAFIDTKIL